ncbi:MAG: hypothetical protein Q9209_002948 [Squamulea sp. 1 TL-2023]
MDIQPSKRRRLDHQSSDHDNEWSSTSGSEHEATQHSVSAKASSVKRDDTWKKQQSSISQPNRHEATMSLEGTAHADLFKLQLDELLRGLRPKYETKTTKLDSVIQKLRSIVERIPNQEALPLWCSPDIRIFSKALEVQKAFEQSNSVCIPFPTPIPTGTKILLAYTKPTNITVVGSYARKTSVLLDGKLTVDLAVTMPSSLFQANDYRDYRYFHKRAYYLACIAVEIQKAKVPALDLFFAYQDDSPLQPILIAQQSSDVDDKGRFHSRWRIRILLAVNDDVFTMEKTLPTRNSGGFGQFEWATLISLLMRDGGRTGRPILSIGHSSYQLFKAILQFLSSTDLISTPMLVQTNNFKLTHSENPILFDGSRGLNILYKMSRWSYRLLRDEAQNSLKALKDPLADHFRTFFISKVDERTKRFDYIFRVPVKKLDKEASNTNSISGLAERLYDKFYYGLGDRATLVYPEVPTTFPWPVGSRVPRTNKLPNISVGLLLNPEHSRRTVDKGPSVEDKSASATFRKFWGEKAELRRFKDGTILESLIWNTSDSKRAVIDLIISHVLDRHFSHIEHNSSNVYGDAFDRLLPQQMLLQSDMLGPFSAVMSSFGSLSKSIRSMEGLPLQIRQMFAASPELRYSSLFAPMTSKPDRPRKPVEILIQFEGSTRWPEDLLAVQRTKIAFLLKTAEGIGKDNHVSTVRLRLERSKRKLSEISCLDIKTRDGIIFRLRIYHERELSMLEQALNGRLPCSSPREEIALAISEHKRNFIHRPIHTQAVTTLATRYPLLSLTIRLLKKWRDSHLLSSHLMDELLELIAIRTFTCPYPWQPPGSLNSAFLRTLRFIANWDWQSDPLIIDFNSELSKQDIQSIRTRFDAWRKLDPYMNRVAMFAASNIDREGITWTDRRPAKIIAARFTKLARAACEVVKEKGLELKPEALFVPTLGEYDFVVYLKGGDHGVKKSSFKNLQMEDEEGDPFDAIYNPQQMFVDELQELYGDDIVFFYNESAISVIAGLWNPQTGPRNWKVGLGYSTMPLAKKEGEEQQVTINKAAVLHDIARLGGDMITKIDQR